MSYCDERINFCYWNLKEFDKCDSILKEIILRSDLNILWKYFCWVIIIDFFCDCVKIVIIWFLCIGILIKLVEKCVYIVV